MPSEQSMKAAREWLEWAAEDCPDHNDRYLETDGEDPYPCPRYACTPCVATLIDSAIAVERERIAWALMHAVYRICEKCNKEYRVPLQWTGNAHAGHGFNFGDCPNCGERDDAWILIKMDELAAIRAGTIDGSEVD